MQRRNLRVFGVFFKCLSVSQSMVTNGIHDSRLTDTLRNYSSSPLPQILYLHIITSSSLSFRPADADLGRMHRKSDHRMHTHSKRQMQILTQLHRTQIYQSFETRDRPFPRVVHIPESFFFEPLRGKSSSHSTGSS